MNTGLHSRAGLPRSRTHPLCPVPSPHTSCPHVVALTRYPSARRAHGLPVSDFASDQQARRGHQAESRSSSYGPVHDRRLLPTSPRDDAVTLGFRPESVCLKRTCTSLDVCASRRTGRRATRADSSDVRRGKYKPLTAPARFVFALSDIAARRLRRPIERPHPSWSSRSSRSSWLKTPFAFVPSLLLLRPFSSSPSLPQLTRSRTPRSR